MTEQSYIGDELEIFSHAHNWKRYFKREIEPYLGNSVLEVGAGIGTTTKILCDGAQKQWICLEPDPQLIKEIDRQIKDGQLPACCTSRIGVTQDLTPNNKFDTILYIDVLEHIENDLAELHTAAKLLKDGGHLIVLSPAYNFLYSPFDHSIGHFRRYDKEMMKFLTPNNCRVFKIFYLDAVGLFISLANKLLLRQSLPTQKQIIIWDKTIIPVSRLLDRLLLFKAGRSIVAIWKKH